VNASLPEADVSQLADVLAKRVSADPEDAAQGLVTMVLGLVDGLRHAMEEEALDRLAAGTLSEADAERVGLALLRLADRMDALRRHLGVDEDDLSLDLGPWVPRP
jgi:hypothetical protein